MALTLIILGLCSLIWQFVALRELHTTFQGNELSLSILLFTWLAGSAIGAFLSRYFLRQPKATASFEDSSGNSKRLLIGILLLNSFLCFLSLFLIRGIKLFLGISPFEILQPLPMLLISSLATMPQTVLLGISFITICALIKNPLKAYYMETLGAFLAGLASLILVKYFNSSEIMWFTSMAFLIAILFLKPASGLLCSLTLISFFCLSLLSWAGFPSRFEHYTNSLRFRPQEVVTCLNSVYAQLALTRAGSHYSLYENGKLSFTTEDTEALEEFAHMILLHHAEPKRILLIGGGASGLLAEILKHPVRSIDYVEQDKKLIDISTRYLPHSSRLGVADKKVTLYHCDARAFIKTTSARYDCVILNLAGPLSLQQNRFYTLEFFQEIRRVLDTEGTFSLTFSSKEDILSGQILSYNASLYKTAKAVFKNITLIPGERLILICSPQSSPRILPGALIQRFQERNITTSYFSPEYLRAKLFRQEYIKERLDTASFHTALNKDYEPYAFFYYLGMWGKQSWLTFNRIWQATGRFNLLHWIGITGLLGFCLRKRSAYLAITTSGFTSIALTIIISLIFQINFGFLYYRLGVIVASFMLGLSAGSLFSQFLLKKDFSWFRLLSYLELSLAGIPLAMLLVLRQNQLLYFLVTLLVALLIGVEFGLFYRKFPVTTVYILDMAGACIGSLLIGIVIIPVLGISGTCAGIALTKLIAFLFLKTQAR